MKNKGLLSIGVLFQVYFLFSWVYSILNFDDFEHQQKFYLKFWFIFSNPVHTSIFLAFITVVVIYFIIKNLANVSESIFMKIFLIIELLFLLFIGWGLL